MMARKGEEEEEDHQQHRQHLRALAARAAAASSSANAAGDRAARVEDCVRCLEAEKAKMEVFRRELPISVHLVADVIEWLKEELAQPQRRGGPADRDLFPPAAKAKAARADAAALVKPEAADKRSWMSSAQLWTCGAATHDHHRAADADADAAANKPKVSNAFMPLAGAPTLGRSPGDDAAEKPGPMPVPDLSLSSPAVDAASPAAAPSATSSAVTDAAGAQQHRQNHHQQQQRKARRCWSPELHRRFVAALQRLGGAQVATPKQIRELMKVDGLTNDEVKSHLQKYRLHTRRASSDGGGHVVGGGAGAAVHDVAAQHVAVRVAAGAPAADGVEQGHVSDGRGQLRRRRGGGRQVRELQLGRGGTRSESVVVRLILPSMIHEQDLRQKYRRKMMIRQACETLMRRRRCR